MSDWTPAATDLTTLLWADGKSASEISRELWDRLGFYATRNAVIGKVHRLRLPKRQAKQKPREASKRASRLRTGRRIILRPPPRLTKPAPIRRRPQPSEAPMPKNLTLMEITDRMCKWPVNDPPRGEPFLFCGAEKEAGIEPYCPYHARLSTGPGTESERRAYRPYREMARECVR